MPKPSINIIWFKRDLRLRDHAPLQAAIQNGLPTLLLYCFEPSMLTIPQSSPRHWKFVWQSLEDMNNRLIREGHQILLFHAEVISVLIEVMQFYQIEHIFSHAEIGLKITFDRDKKVKAFCNNNSINYQEFDQDGIIRGRKHRAGWQEYVQQHFSSPPLPISIDKLVSINSEKEKPFDCLSSLNDSPKLVAHKPLPFSVKDFCSNFQKGGEILAWRYLKSFLEKRSKNYSKQLSKPALSRTSCSRISPYLAYGNISVKELWQWTKKYGKLNKDRFNITNFQSRLWWRSHFMQKLEAEWQIEFEPINRALKIIDRTQDEIFLDAWKTGKTGYPMVDANMRCLQATGWINFRMRAMLTSFATFTLWLHWKPVSYHLAQLFLDFEPGIHYPQIQMQAGLTGYHTLRIYNPTFQIQKHDTEAKFIHQWLPELKDVPAPYCYEPWKLSLMEQTFYNCQIGVDYPTPIIDFEKATRKHKDRYWAFRQSPEVKRALPEIWQRHLAKKDWKKYEQQMEKIEQEIIKKDTFNPFEGVSDELPF